MNQTATISTSVAQIGDCQRHAHPRSFHEQGGGISITGLAIGKDSAVVALKNRVDNGTRGGVKHNFLPCVPVVDLVKREGLCLLPGICLRILDHDLHEHETTCI